MKKTITFLLALILCLSLCSCGKDTESTNNDNNNIVDQNENNNSVSTDNILALNKTYTIDDYAEISLFKAHTTDKVTAPGGSFYYQPNEGQVFVDLIFTMTNISTSAINSEDFAILTGTGASGTNYTSTCYAVESGSDISQYSSINPLEKNKNPLCIKRSCFRNFC